MPNYQEKYNSLKETRQLLNPNKIDNIKKQSLYYFSDLNIDLVNLEKNFQIPMTFYKAPVRKIHNTNLVNWHINNGNEIYIDELFLLNPENESILNCQLTHEILHTLSQSTTNKQLCFGHNTPLLTGLDEATTQILAEDIIGIRLSEQEDYLYFIKNIMRVMKVITGEELLADQYLNHNHSFEQTFNKISSNNFEYLVTKLNQIYNLSKKEWYQTISNSEKLHLAILKKQLLKFTKIIIEAQEVPDNKIITELQDEKFLKLLKINNPNTKKRLRIS